MKKGVILINLGTPDSPSPLAVGKYLREFLMDPYVIDLPVITRSLLVYGAILPTRPFSSAKLYKKIWTENGSPLLVHTEELATKVQDQLGTDYVVRPAMRYGKPSIRNAVNSLKEMGVEEITALPLYPQYSLAATESSIAALEEALPNGQKKVLPAFFDDSRYLDAVAEISKVFLAGKEFDHFLFSFHGLPERQIKKLAGCQDYCQFNDDCCKSIVNENRNCYRAQSFATAKEIANRLSISESDYTVCFQSRLGRTPWIQPYTDLLLPKLAEEGKKSLAVFCPSFVADCLETLEEIQIRGHHAFLEAGGKHLELIPSLNASDVWAQSVAQMVTQ